jgi:hypothetical protein
MHPILFAEISGDTLVNALIYLVVYGVVAGLLWWIVDFAGLPAPFNKVAKVLIALVAVILVIRLLLRVTGVEL